MCSDLGRKSGQLYNEEDPNSADNFVKNKASKWTKNLSVTNSAESNNNTSPTGAQNTQTPKKSFAALLKAAAIAETVPAGSPARSTGSEGSESPSTGSFPIPEGAEITVPRDVLHNVLALRGSLKQQVVNIHSELDLLDAHLLKMMKSVSANQEGASTKAPSSGGTDKETDKSS